MVVVYILGLQHWLFNELCMRVYFTTLYHYIFFETIFLPIFLLLVPNFDILFYYGTPSTHSRAHTHTPVHLAIAGNDHRNVQCCRTWAVGDGIGTDTRIGLTD